MVEGGALATGGVGKEAKVFELWLSDNREILP